MALLTNRFQRTGLYHHRLTNTIHLTLEMTSAQVVETSVTNNSSFQNYTHRDDHTICEQISCIALTKVSNSLSIEILNQCL